MTDITPTPQAKAEQNEPDHTPQPGCSRGFLVALSLIAAIVATYCTIGTTCGRRHSNQKNHATLNNMHAVMNELQEYQLDHGRYPSNLTELIEATPGLPINDQWGRPLRYQQNAPGTCDIYSLGKDGIAGTADDVAPR